MTMRDLAHHIIAVANEHNMPVTNLQLQKVMYFSLQEALNRNLYSEEEIRRIYDEPFLVWRYGPVVENIYNKYRIYGANSIIEKNELHDNLNGLNSIIISLLRENIFELVGRSHREQFWMNNEHEITGWRSNIEYGLHDIISG